MGGLRLLKDHFDSLETLLLVVELSANHIVKMLTVLSRFIPQVVEHLLRSKVLTSNFLGVH